MTPAPRLRVPLRTLLLCFGLSIAAPAWASIDIQVPVESQSPALREQALAQALQRVLVRMTGRDDIAQQPALAETVANPGRFVQRYRYQNVPAEGLKLVVQFDDASLRRVLAERGVAIWEPERPPALVWLALEQDGQRVLVGADEAPTVRAQLLEAAQARGISLLFPLLDAEDRGRVRFTDIWGGFREQVQAASQRYGTPVIVTARMHRERGEWVSRWALSTPSGDSSWATAAPELEGALVQAVGDLGAYLAREYAAVPGTAVDGGDLRLRISGVADMAAFARLEAYLRELAGVKDVLPLAFDDQTLLLQVDLETDRQRVIRVLDAGGVLAPVEVLAPGGPVEPAYRLLR